MSFLNQLALNNLFYYYTYFFNTLSNKILSLNHLYFFVNRMKSTKSCYLKKKSYKIFVNTVLNCCVSIWQCLNTLEDWRNWTVPSQALLLSGVGGIIQRIFIIIFNRTFLCHDIDNKTKSAIMKYFGWVFVCHPSTYF